MKTTDAGATESPMTEHPLIFTLRDVVSGQGFLAGITLSGKGLMLKEDEKWWLYGVRPGAIAASGETPDTAFWNFRQRYKETLFDMAESAKNFGEFRSAVEAFYEQPDPVEEERWEKALRLVRAGLKIPAPFDKLPQEAPETRPSSISVQRLDSQQPRYTPSDNVIDTYVYSRAA